ncbi:MAG TPA: extracellular solute-binding protein [bacterium]|nr:extracellular solute-binding protein [bacterium]
MARSAPLPRCRPARISLRRCALAAPLIIASLVSCHRGPAEVNEEKGLTILANAAVGGVNSQLADWLDEELPGISKELGVPVAFLSAGLNDQDFKARVALDIKGGRAADVIGLDQFWTPEFAGAGFIMPLDRYFSAWPVREQYFAPIREMGSFRGHVYQVIWNADLRMIFYNREIFRRAGLALPWRPRSWDDILAAGRTIKERCPGVTPLQLDAGTVMGEASTMQGFYMVLLGAGGRLYDPARECWITDSAPIRRAARFYRVVYQDEKLGDPDLQVAAKAREKSFDLFSAGKIAVYIESTWFYTSVLSPTNDSWGIKDRDDRIGWAPMPGGGRSGDPEFVSISGGDGLIINPHCKNPELAWKLVMALNDLGRQQRLFLKKPFTPTRRDLAELPEVMQHRFISETARAIMPCTTFRPALPEYPEVSFQVQYLTERLATGQLGVDAALAEFGQSVANAVGQDKVCGAGPGQ